MEVVLQVTMQVGKCGEWRRVAGEMMWLVRWVMVMSVAEWVEVVCKSSKWMGVVSSSRKWIEVVGR